MNIPMTYIRPNKQAYEVMLKRLEFVVSNLRTSGPLAIAPLVAKCLDALCAKFVWLTNRDLHSVAYPVTKW